MSLSGARRYAADLTRGPNAERILIVGGPRTGKSTLSRIIGDLRGMRRMCGDPLDRVKDVESGVAYAPAGGWSDTSSYVADRMLARPGPWVLDGVGVPRALRKWRDAHPGRPAPAERLVVLRRPWVDLLPGQAAMAKGIDTVLSEVMPWLRQSGVAIHDDSSVLANLT